MGDPFTILVEALRRAHACATLREDGSCDGCFVSEALTSAAVADELVDECQKRMDAVVDAAVTYIQDEPDHDWEKHYDALESAVQSLLELREVKSESETVYRFSLKGTK